MNNFIRGNIHYGYVGIAVGFFETELTNGAGVAQLKTIISQYTKGKSKPAEEAWERVKKDISFAAIDPPDDKAAVILGTDLWGRKKSNLVLNTFISEIRNNKASLSVIC